MKSDSALGITLPLPLDSRIVEARRHAQQNHISKHPNRFYHSGVYDAWPELEDFCRLASLHWIDAR